MVNIKITYQSTLRRFSIAPNTSWAELESKLRTLFSISQSVPLLLSYTDEDGDLISLSTDLELQEVLGQQESTSTYKFVLITGPADESKESWVLEGAAMQSEGSVNTVQDETESIRDGFSGLALAPEQQKMQVEEETAPSYAPNPEPESRPPSYHVTLTDEAEETTSFTEKGKEKETGGETSASAAATSGDQQKQEDSPPPPFAELADQFQMLLNQFQDVLVQNPQIIETANNVMDQIVHSIPVDMEIWAEWLQSLRPDGQGSAEGENQQTRDGETRPPHSFPQTRPPFTPNFFHWSPPTGCPGYGNRYSGHHRFAGRGCFGPDFPFGNRHWNPMWSNGAQWGNPGPCRGRDRRCGRGSGGCHRQTNPQTEQQQITPQALQEKLALLQNMGFEGDDQTRQLLTRYNGNVERVVEVLIQKQETAARQHDQQEDPAAQPMEEVEQEMRPYSFD